MNPPASKTKTKQRLGHHFQKLVNAVADAGLGPEHLEAVELIIAAKQRCWQLMDGEDPKYPALLRMPGKRLPRIFMRPLFCDHGNPNTGTCPECVAIAQKTGARS